MDRPFTDNAGRDDKVFSPRSKAEQVAMRLLDAIAAAGHPPGTSLGTEADLLAAFDVSRPTLREALRILESQGVLELRQGPGGGILVRQPSVDILAHGLSVFLRLNEVPFISLLQARELIEPTLAREAALNGTETDFAAMEASIARMASLGEDEAAFVEENRVFHGIVARAGGNRVLETFWATISILADGHQHGVRYSFGNRRHVIAAHRAILDACRARNPDAAAARMREHVGALEHLVRERYRHLLQAPTSVVSRPARRGGTAAR